MRRAFKLIAVTAAVFLFGAAVYLGSCLIALKHLGDSARASDGQAVLLRTDLPRLRQSLAVQILAAYERRAGANKQSTVLRQLLQSVGPNIADQIVAQILTPERLSALLARGTVQVSSKAEAVQMPALTDLKSLDALTQVRFINPVTLGFRTKTSDDAYVAVMHFADFQWKLAGIELPEPVLAKIVAALR